MVRALNDNQPFDEFIRWQLAGDLLPNPTEDQKIATGYVRMNPTTGEVVPLPLSFRRRIILTGWKPLVPPCLDYRLPVPVVILTSMIPSPIEYFEFLAFFNNTMEHSMDEINMFMGTILPLPKILYPKRNGVNF